MSHCYQCFSFSHVVSGSGLSAGDGQTNIQPWSWRVHLCCLNYLPGYHYDIPLHTYDFGWKLQKLNSHMHNSQYAHAGWYSTFWPQSFYITAVFSLLVHWSRYLYHVVCICLRCIFEMHRSFLADKHICKLQSYKLLITRTFCKLKYYA